MREVNVKSSSLQGVLGHRRRGGVGRMVGLSAFGLTLNGCLTKEDLEELTNKFVNSNLKSSLAEVAGQKLETSQFEFEGNLEIADKSKFLFRDENKKEVKPLDLERVYEDGRTKIKAIFDKGVVSKEAKISLYYLGEKAFKFSNGKYSKSWDAVVSKDDSDNNIPVFEYPDDEMWTYNLVTGSGALGNFIATDADSDDKVSYRLEGSDADLFNLINGVKDVVYVLFKKRPDPYNPQDADKDGQYEVSVVAYDGKGGEAKKSIVVDVFHRGGSDPYAWVLQEGNQGSLKFYDGNTDTSKYTLKGDDASFFEIVGGALRFKVAPSFDTPEDEGKDNTYEVTVVKPSTIGGSYESHISVRIVGSEGDTNRAPKFDYKNSDLYDASAVFYDKDEKDNSIDYGATDPDGDKVSYTLKGADRDFFSVTDEGVVNFKTAPVSGRGSFGGHYVFTVVASDGKGGIKEAHALVFVHADDWGSGYEGEELLLGWGGIVEDLL